MSEPAHNAITFNLVLSWVGGAIGAFTLSEAVLWATLVFTVINIHFTIRDRWWRERPEWREKNASNDRRKR